MEFVLTDENDERFLKLVSELDRGYYERIGDELAKYDEYNEFKTPHVVLLALDSKRPIACASYRTFNENSAEFKRVYVKKDYRKRGVAYNLIKQLEKLVIRDNFRYSYIVTGKNNHAAIELYKKLDYQLIDNFDEFADDEAVVCMKKEFKSKKLAIFDFDGTLLDSVHDVVDCFNKTLTKYGFRNLTREEFLKYLGGNIDEIVSLILEEKSTPENIKMVKDTYLNMYYSSDKEKSVPFPKSHEILRYLQDMGVILAINSNRFNDSIDTFLLRFFTDIEFISRMGHDFDYPSKPDPYGVHEIIKKAGVSLDEAIYIGDSSTDIKTARNAGIDCVIVKWGYGNEDDWNDDYVLEAIDDFDEIIKYF